MKNEQIKTFFKVLITLALIGTLAFLITKDFLKIKSAFTANALWHSLGAQREKVKNKAILITINHYRPDLSQWTNFFVNNTLPDKSFLNDSVRYYEMIRDYAPQMAETYYLLGLCHYFLGDNQEALANEQKATALEPHFFWAWYNLGLMYYRAGLFEQSAKSFQMALNVRPAATIKVVQSSRIFTEILHSIALPDVVNAQSLQNGYVNAIRMLQASIKRWHGQPAGFDDAQVPFKIY